MSPKVASLDDALYFPNPVPKATELSERWPADHAVITAVRLWIVRFARLK
ncbi:MAG: hypothetical protein WA240_08300 [Nitrospirota bacterium]